MRFENPGLPVGNPHEARPIRKENVEARIDAEIIINGLNGEKPSETDFIDENKKGYTSLDIQNDLKRVAEREEDFKANYDHLDDLDIEKIETGKMRATALEKICINMAGKRDSNGTIRYGWYGERAHTSESVKTDDIFNGVDGFLEFDMGKGQSRKIALAIDASMRADVTSVRRKMRRGAEKMVEGKMKVKYFKSAVNEYKGELKSIIPIVLGLEGEKANHLIKLFAEIVKLETLLSRTTDDEISLAYKIREAREHPCQVIFLKEMKVQLQMYQKIFTRKDSFLESDLRDLLEIINSLLLEKSHINEDSLVGDGVFEKICEVANELPLHRDEIMGFKKK